MTLSEKANLTSGILARCAGTLGSVPRFGIPEFCLQDGPAGLRGVNGGSQFPAGLTVAATWDRDLIYERARAMGQEWRDQGRPLLYFLFVQAVMLEYELADWSMNDGMM